MGVVGIIVIAVVLLLFFIVYVLYVVNYLGMRKQYKEALCSDGIILEILDESSMAVGMSKYGTKIERRFGEYLVEFQTDNGKTVMQVPSVKRKACVGDSVKVRYYYDEEGELKIVSEAFLSWQRQLVIGYSLGIIAGIVLAFMDKFGLL